MNELSGRSIFDPLGPVPLNRDREDMAYAARDNSASRYRAMFGSLLLPLACADCPVFNELAQLYVVQHLAIYDENLSRLCSAIDTSA